MPTTHYLWDPIEDNIIAEFDDDGNVLVEYTTEPDFHGRPISMTRDGHTYTFHDDGFGNVLALTDENGNVTDTYSHTAFGTLVERTGTTVNPFQWQGMNGYYTDEDGTVNVRRRQYSPALARWMSPDPLVQHMERLQALLGIDLNAYRYAWNRPTVLTDPSGLDSCNMRHWEQRIGQCFLRWNPDGSATFGKRFESILTFGNVDDHLCICCSFRQYVSGVYRVNGRVTRRLGKRVGADWVPEEDCDPDLIPPCYGHRSEPGVYSNEYSEDGCIYRMSDEPSFDFPVLIKVTSSWAIKATFMQKVIDTCPCRLPHPTIEERNIEVDCELNITNLSVGSSGMITYVVKDKGSVVQTLHRPYEIG